MNEHDNKPSVETTTPQAGAVDDLQPRPLEQFGELFGFQELVPVVRPARHRAR